jgi:hypothetical protein
MTDIKYIPVTSRSWLYNIKHILTHPLTIISCSGGLASLMYNPKLGFRNHKNIAIIVSVVTVCSTVNVLRYIIERDLTINKVSKNYSKNKYCHKDPIIIKDDSKSFFIPETINIHNISSNRIAFPVIHLYNNNPFHMSVFLYDIVDGKLYYYDSHGSHPNKQLSDVITYLFNVNTIEYNNIMHQTLDLLDYSYVLNIIHKFIVMNESFDVICKYKITYYNTFKFQYNLNIIKIARHEPPINCSYRILSC